MAITRVRLHRQLHPFRRGGYAMHYGSVAGEESFVVALEDDSGITCLLYTSPSPRDRTRSRMPSSA